MSKKIGILGGTFNPIHNAHITLAQNAIETAHLDEVWVMPSGCSYLKNQADIASGKDRMAMVLLAVEDIPNIIGSNIELLRSGNTYTYETLEILNRQYPNDQFFWILGADNLYGIETWKCPEIIFRHATILVAVRDDKDMTDILKQMEYLKHKFDARLLPLTMKNMPVSSSEIRGGLKLGKNVSSLIPDKVYSYIMEHELYGFTKRDEESAG